MQKEIINLLKNNPKLLPIDTGLQSSGKKLKNIKAVIFDIYGTLLISGSGDVGTSIEAGSYKAFEAAFRKCGIDTVSKEASEYVREQFFSSISSTHESMRADGYPYPEIDIIEVWENIISSKGAERLLPEIKIIPAPFIAAAYESTVNPVYPMPGAKELIEKLKSSGFRLGIISNAQFYTPLIIKQYFGGDPHKIGFEKSLCLFSYIERRSKPDTALFSKLSSSLSKFNIKPEESIFIGNDMLKDIMPSKKTGYKTALFAGDKRSLRLHKNNDACSKIVPDVILQRLLDLNNFIGVEQDEKRL